MRKYLALLLSFLMIIPYLGPSGMVAQAQTITTTPEIIGGDGFTVMLDSAGTVRTWGDGANGVFGNNSPTDRTSPGPIYKLNRVTEISAAGSYVIALRSDGTVWHWGNYNGTSMYLPTQVRASSTTMLTNITSIAAGMSTTNGQFGIARRSDGSAWAWGANNNGQLGDGTTTDSLSFAKQVKANSSTGLLNVSSVAAGRGFSMALLSDGTVRAWGTNSLSQLGNGGTTNSSYPVQVKMTSTTNLTGVTKISAYGNGSMAMARTSGGLAYMWGENAYGQLGRGTTTTGAYAVTVKTASATNLTGVTEIAAGYRSAYALNSTGGYGWGSNTNNLVGDGTTTNRTYAVRIKSNSTTNFTGIKSFGASVNNGYIIKTDNTVWGWGANSLGTLGDGTTTAQAYPVQVFTPLADVVYPTSPTLSATNLNEPAKSFDLNWDGSFDEGGVAGYEVYINGTLNWITTVSSLAIVDIENFASESTDSIFNNNTYSVIAYDAAGNRADEVSMTYALPDTTPPAKPVPTEIQNGAKTMYQLDITMLTNKALLSQFGVDEIDNSKKVASYKIYDADGNFITNAVLQGDDGNTGYFRIYNLLPSTQYTYKIKAVDAAGNISEFSDPVTVSTVADTQAPAPPSSLSVSASGVDTADIMGSLGYDNDEIMHYEIYSDGVLVGTDTLSGLSTRGAPVTISGLVPGTTQTVTFVAVDRSGNKSVASDGIVVTTLPDTESPSAPATGSATNVTKIGAKLVWSGATDNTRVTSYSIYNSGGLVGTTGSTEYTLNNLDPGTEYTYTINSVDSSGNESVDGYSVTFETLPDEPPTTPGTPVVADISRTGATLSWAPSSDDFSVSGYNIYSGDVLVGSTDLNNYALADLNPDTAYSYSVSAYDDAGNESERSSVVNFATLPDAPPSAPSGLVKLSSTTDSISISWQEGTDDFAIESYRVMVNGELFDTYNTNEAVITGLQPGSDYEISVYSVDDSNNISLDAAVATFSTQPEADTTPPTTPAGLSASEILADGFTFGWESSSDNIAVTGYVINLNGVDVGETTDSEYTITGLDSYTEYSVTVKAKDAADNISTASAVLTVRTLDNIAPTTPLELVVNAVSGDGFSVSWGASTDNSGQVEYGVYLNNELITTTGDTAYSFTGLDDFSEYSVTIKAKDAAGNESDMSDPLAVKTLDTTAPTVPVDLVHDIVEPNNASISWSGSSDNDAVVGYNIYKNGVLFGTSETTNFLAEGLQKNVDHNFTVRAFDAAGNLSADSDILVINIPPGEDMEAPTTPGEVIISNVLADGFTISWGSSTDNVGVDRYLIYLGGSLVSEVTTLDHVLTGLDQYTEYAVEVSAVDAAGNESIKTAVKLVRTLDTEAPTIPEGIVAANVSSSAITLNWIASTDNAGVTRYKIFRNGSHFGNSKTPTYTFTELPSGTKYNFTISAIDAAGNESEQSDVIEVETLQYLAINSFSVTPTENATTSISVSYSLKVTGIVNVRVIRSSDKFVITSAVSNRMIYASTNPMLRTVSLTGYSSGEYTVVITAAQPTYANQKETRTIKITVNRPKAVLSEVSATNINENAESRSSTISYKLGGVNSKVSAAITTSIGTVIKTLESSVSKVASDTTAYTLQWDGKTRTGALAKVGVYYLRIMATTPLNITTTVTVPIRVSGEVPVISQINATGINRSDSVRSSSIKYTLSENSRVILAIYSGDGKRLIKYLHRSTAKNGGENTVVWDGKDSRGLTAPVGTYVVRMHATDQLGLKSGWQTGTITVQ